MAEARKKIGFNYNNNIGFRLAIKLEANIQTLIRVSSSSVLLLSVKDLFLSIEPSNGCLRPLVSRNNQYYGETFLF